MGPPLLVKIYAFIADTINVDIEDLGSCKSLPSDYMMDNHIFYGENPIIGNRPLQTNEFEFPISFGRSTDFSRKVIFLQWGFIHLEQPLGTFKKYLYDENDPYGEHNPYGYYSIGSYHRYMTKDIRQTIEKGHYRFDSDHYKDQWDLRNPRNEKIKKEILENFGLLPDKSYLENCKKIGIDPVMELK